MIITLSSYLHHHHDYHLHHCHDYNLHNHFHLIISITTLFIFIITLIIAFITIALYLHYHLCHLHHFDYTVEPRYNEVLGTVKITLLYQVSHYNRAKKQRNINSWDQQNYLVIRGFCYIRPLYNEVPLYHLHHHLNYQHHILYHLHHHHIISFIAITVSSPYHFHHQIIFIIMFVFRHHLVISITLSSS